MKNVDKNERFLGSQFRRNILWKVGVLGWEDWNDGAEAFIVVDAPGFILNAPGLYRNIFVTGRESGGHGTEPDWSQNRSAVGGAASENWSS